MHRILYVDDEPGLLEITKLFLEQTNDFSVDIDTAAQHALHSIGTQFYDAIISDYQMPEMDGITFLKTVRSKHGDIPFILFTGRGREEVVIEAINNGADFYLQKGGDPEAQFAELTHKIRQAIARRQAEFSLIESEKRLADIINFLPDATFAIDRSGKVIAWNRAIEDMTGVTASDMLGKGDYEYAIPFYNTRRRILIDLVFEPDEVIAQNYAHIFHEKDILIADTTLPRPMGRTVTLMGKASPLYNRQGEIVGAIESIRDITVLKEAEKGLLHAQKDWETIFRAIGHPAIVLNANNRIIDANDAALIVTAKTLEDLKERHCYEVFHGPDADHPPDGCPFEQLKKTGTTETAEMEIEALNGYYHVSCTSVYDATGNLEKVIHIAMDVTARRRIQSAEAAYEQLSASQEELKGQDDELAMSEQRIRESETKFRELAELLPQMVFEIDLDRRITFANQYAFTTMGLNREDFLQGVTAFSCIDPAEHQRVRLAIEKLIRGEEDEDNEYTMIRRDGSRFPALIYIAMVYHAGTLAGFRGVAVDISARKKTEDELRESEEEFRTLFNNAIDEIYIHELLPDGTPGKFLEVNGNMCSRSGYTREELLTMTISDIVSGAHRQKMPDIGLQIAKTGFHTFYGEHKRKDGSVFPVEINIRRFTLSGKDIVLAAARDITKRKQMEDILREREATLSSIFRVAPVGIGLVSNRVLLRVNTRICEMTGYSAEELIGKSARILYPDDEEYEWVGLEKYEQIQKSGTGTVETRWRMKDGTIRDILLSSTPLDPENQRIGVTFTAMDITEYKRAVDALRLRDRAIASSINAIAISDLNGTITYVNDAFTRLWGYSVQEAVGIPVTRLGSTEDEVPKFVTQIKTQGYAVGESIAKRKDGSLFSIQISASLVIDDSGKPEAMLSSFIEITDRKRAESELHSAYEKLSATEEELRGQYEELAATQAELQKRQQQLEEITGTVAGVVFQFYARPDSSMGFYYVSSRAPELLGISNNTGDFFERFTMQIDPRDSQDFLNSVNEVIRLRSPWNFEGRFIKPSDEKIWFQGISQPFTSGTEIVFSGVLLDITERKRSEALLHESEEKYRTLIETTSTGFVILDEKGQVIAANPEYVRLTGHESVSGIVGRSVIEWTAQYEKERNAEAITRCLREGYIRNFEIDYTDVSGNIIPIEINATVMRSEDSIQILTLCRDISERRRTQDALRESEEKYRMLVEHSNDGVFVVQETRLVFYNRAFAEMTGYGGQELIGRSINELIAPEDRELAMARHKERMSDGKAPEMYEFAVLHKDGSSRVRVRMHAGVGKYKGKPATFGTFYNVTEERKREEAVRESEQRLLLAVDGGELGTWNWNVVTGEVIFNRRWANMLGYRLDEIEPNVRSWERLVHPDDMPLVQKILTAHLEGKRETYECEHRLLHKSGSWTWVHDKGRVIRRDDEGRPLVAAGTHLDITQRKHAEDMVHSLAQFPAENPHPVLRIASNGTLLYANNPGLEWLAALQENAGPQLPDSIQSLVTTALNKEGSHNTELQNGSGRIYQIAAIRPVGEEYVNIYVSEITERKLGEQTIKEANKKINLLTSITRHDVANQVSILRGFAKIAMMQKPDPIVIDLLAKIDTAGSTIARQIAFTKEYQELGMHTPSWHPIREIITHQKTEGITLSCTCDAEVFADPMLEKVFFNLIDNAARHGERVSTIMVSCKPDQHGLVITVEDNGIGVPIDLKGKIFEKGFGKNTGFGLFLAREILEITGITIHETGLYGKGARFEISVPKGVYRYSP